MRIPPATMKTTTTTAPIRARVLLTRISSYLSVWNENRTLGGGGRTSRIGEAGKAVAGRDHFHGDRKQHQGRGVRQQLEGESIARPELSQGGTQHREQPAQRQCADRHDPE